MTFDALKQMSAYSLRDIVFSSERSPQVRLQCLEALMARQPDIATQPWFLSRHADFTAAIQSRRYTTQIR